MLNQANEFRLGRQWNRDIKSSAFASILFPMQLMAPLNLRAYSNVFKCPDFNIRTFIDHRLKEKNVLKNIYLKRIA